MSLERAISAAFRQTRKGRLQKSDLIYFFALEKKWMSREQAARLVEIATERGLLGNEGGLLYPKFDTSAIDIPLGYRPGEEVFALDEPYQLLLERIAKRTNKSLQEVAKELNELVHAQFDGHLRAEAAAVILAKKYGVPFADLIGRLREKLTGRE